MKDRDSSIRRNDMLQAVQKQKYLIFGKYWILK